MGPTSKRGLASYSPAVGMLMFCLGLAACGPDSNVEVASIQAAVTSGRTAFQYVQQFNVAVLKSTTASGSPLTCADIPNPFPLDSNQLQFDARTSFAWNKGTTEATVEELLVSANTNLLIAVEGVVGWARAGAVQHAVVRGCQENLRFAKGTSGNAVRINAEPTVGAPCSQPSDCEPTLEQCLNGLEFSNGYCTILGCASDNDCVPGSHCVNTGINGSGNICARLCSGLDDCDAGSEQECVRRTGPSGCRSVCVRATWNLSGSC